MEDVIKKQYTLHYILKPDFTNEEELHKRRQLVSEKLQAIGGEVEASVCQEGARRLSYPIKKTDRGYFCEAVFRLAPEELIKLEDSLRLENGLLRYFVEFKDQARKPKRLRSRVALFQKKTPPPSEVKQQAMPPSHAEEKKEKVSMEELDKKLDEIMKNI